MEPDPFTTFTTVQLLILEMLLELPTRGLVVTGLHSESEFTNMLRRVQAVLDAR